MSVRLETLMRTHDAHEFFEQFPKGKPARLLGVDLGEKTLGIALSDVFRSIATPLVLRKRESFTKDAIFLKAIVDEHRISGFVFGYPLLLNGDRGRSCQRVESFCHEWTKRDHSLLPILFWDERFSTKVTEDVLISADLSRKRRQEVIDKMAAVYILQGALDRARYL